MRTHSTAVVKETFEMNKTCLRNPAEMKNPFALPDLSFYWSLSPVASAVIKLTDMR